MDEATVFQNYIAERDRQVALLDERFGKGQWSWSVWMDQFPVWDYLTPQERVAMFGQPT
jgi:hypothetical protein